jgi:hypothetical protein
MVFREQPRPLRVQLLPQLVMALVVAVVEVMVVQVALVLVVF